MVIPTWDRTLPTTLSCLDAMLRRFGAAPTYLFIDNERVATTDRVAGIAVGHPSWWRRDVTTARDRAHGKASARASPPNCLHLLSR